MERPKPQILTNRIQMMGMLPCLVQLLRSVLYFQYELVPIYQQASPEAS